MTTLTLLGALMGIALCAVILAIIGGMLLLVVRRMLMNNIELDDLEDWEDSE